MKDEKGEAYRAERACRCGNCEGWGKEVWAGRVTDCSIVRERFTQDHGVEWGCPHAKIALGRALPCLVISGNNPWEARPQQGCRGGPRRRAAGAISQLRSHSRRAKQLVFTTTMAAKNVDGRITSCLIRQR